MKFKQNKTILKCGYDDLVESVLFNRTLGSVVTDEEAAVLYPFFLNLTTMIWAAHVVKNGVEGERDDIITETVANVFTYMLPKFDPTKYKGNPINFFCRTIRFKLIQIVNRLYNQQSPLVSIDGLKEEDGFDEGDEPMLHIDPMYETGKDNEEVHKLMEKQHLLFEEMLEWFAKRKVNKGGAATYKRQKKILKAVAKLVKHPDKFIRRDHRVKDKGSALILESVQELSGIDDPVPTCYVGNLLRGLFVIFAREKYNVFVTNTWLARNHTPEISQKILVGE